MYYKILYLNKYLTNNVSLLFILMLIYIVISLPYNIYFGTKLVLSLICVLDC